MFLIEKEKLLHHLRWKVVLESLDETKDPEMLQEIFGMYLVDLLLWLCSKPGECPTHAKAAWASMTGGHIFDFSKTTYYDSDHRWVCDDFMPGAGNLNCFCWNCGLRWKNHDQR